MRHAGLFKSNLSRGNELMTVAACKSFMTYPVRDNIFRIFAIGAPLNINTLVYRSYDHM